MTSSESIRWPRSPWTNKLLSFGMFGTPVLVMVYRNSLNHGWFRKRMEMPQLPDQPDEAMVELIESELVAYADRRDYPIERPFTPFGIIDFLSSMVERHFPVERAFSLMPWDNIESATYGFFYCSNNALFRFSTRLALQDINSVRAHYPNLLDLFRANFSRTDLRGAWRNFREARTLRDLRSIFRQKNMMDFRVDTAKLSDEELQKVLLSEKAKKFAITHEILYADSFLAMMPLHTFIMSFGLGWLMYTGIRGKVGDVVAIVVALLLACTMAYQMDKMNRVNEVLKMDIQTAQSGEQYFVGAKEYLQASIELGKLLHRLTDGLSDFDVNGDYEGHVAPYTMRLRRLEQQEQELAKTRVASEARRKKHQEQKQQQPREIKV